LQAFDDPTIGNVILMRIRKRPEATPMSIQRAPRWWNAHRAKLARVLVRRDFWLAQLLALSACVGNIGDPLGSPGGSAAPGSTSGDQADSGTGAATGPAVASTGDGGAPAVVLSVTSRLARLSHTQLLNTYRDLLGITDVSDADSILTPDAVVGYDNEGDALYVTDQLWANLQQVAELYANTVATTPKLLAALVPANAPTDAAGKAKAFVQAFGLRAYRRPLTDAEVQTYLTLFNQGTALIGGTDPFAAGAQLVLQAFLQSPHFLYRTELSDQVVGDRIPLSDYEVASKISYAVTNTMPDPALFAAAAQGAVASRANLATQVGRLLATPAGTAQVEHFHFQMYAFGVYDGITKDPAVYPQFTAATGPAMEQESLLFFAWIFNGGKGVADIYTSPVSFVNNLLAPTYGLKGTFTSAFTQVNLDPTQRAGVLTQLGFLANEATTETISTILRGAFVNTHIFCVVLPPPSPLASPLPAIQPGETDRQLVNSFTGPGTCAAGCHTTLLNPPGFAFENYDAIGAYRTTDQGQPVDASSSYTFAAPYGTQSWTTPIEFANVISKAPQVHGCYVQNWASYLYGRPVADSATGDLLSNDAPYLQYLTQQSLSNGLPVKDMILSIATDDTFLARSPGVSSTAVAGTMLDGSVEN
jgi:Protein of unknown function (DUF1592)/Protein of unknown function (DUF1595)/Protein of unknown function (DUF1588)/Protein of unknown function (DUF1587)/Protein of unknown function (DUF1585)